MLSSQPLKGWYGKKVEFCCCLMSPSDIKRARKQEGEHLCCLPTPSDKNLWVCNGSVALIWGKSNVFWNPQHKKSDSRLVIFQRRGGGGRRGVYPKSKLPEELFAVWWPESKLFRNFFYLSLDIIPEGKGGAELFTELAPMLIQSLNCNVHLLYVVCCPLLESRNHACQGSGDFWLKGVSLILAN